MQIPFLTKKNQKQIIQTQTLGASSVASNFVKITPNKLKNIFNEYDFKQRQDLFVELEADDAIAAHMPTRKEAILGLDWQIKANRSNTPKALELADKIADIFYDLPDFENFLVYLMHGIFTGVAVVEIEWDYKNNLYLPKKFHSRPLSLFGLEKGELKYKTGFNNFEKLKDFGFIIHAPQTNTKNFKGLFEALAYLYMFKKSSVYDFAEFLENYGQPIKIGKYPPFATDGEKASLLKALVEIGHNTAGIIPEAMSVDIINTTGNNGESFLSMINRCDSAIAKIILGQTLTSDNKGAGSYALGRVHNEVRRDLLIGDAKKIANTLTTELIYKILALNFADVKKTDLPYFEFNTSEAADLEYYSKALPPLISAGVKFPMRYINEILNIPPKADDDIYLENNLTAARDVLTKSQMEQSAILAKKNNDLSAQSEDYALLDTALENSLADENFNEQLSAIDDFLLKIIQKSSSYTELEQNLSTYIEKLDTKTHEKYLERALNIAYLIGFKG